MRRIDLLLPSLCTLLLPGFSTMALEHPQPELPSLTLRLGQLTVKAEVADEPDEKSIGLMGREKLADGEGMLFVFHQAQPMNFWMKNTMVPLSIAYLNAVGVIREIHDLEPFNETGVQSTVQDLFYALEVPQGWFQKNKILPGDRILGLPTHASPPIE